MGHTIIRLELDAYLIWSSVVDAPVGGNIRTREEMLGQLTDGRHTFWQRMTRQKAEESMAWVDAQADAGGPVWTDGKQTTEDLFAWNRAGPGETCLTREELIAAYTGGE